MVVRSVQMHSGDARGKKGLEDTMESLKDLTLEHRAWHHTSTAVLLSHLHSVCPQGTTEGDSQQNLSQRQPPNRRDKAGQP